MEIDDREEMVLRTAWKGREVLGTQSVYVPYVFLYVYIRIFPHIHVDMKNSVSTLKNSFNGYKICILCDKKIMLSRSLFPH